MAELYIALSGFDSINFRYPFILYSLYILPLLSLLAIANIIQSSRILPILDAKPRNFLKALRATSSILAIAFFIAALAEPFGTEIYRKPVWRGEVVDFVIDLSLSQNAEDVKPRRLEAGKKAILEAAEALNAGGITKLCLAFFTARFNRLLECTPDIDNFKALVERLDPTLAGNVGGTNLLAAIPNDYAMIKKDVIPEGSRITLFLITDGGREMARDKFSGAMLVSEPDWKEDELKKKIVELSSSGVRIIPVGIGGTKPAPVIVDGESYYSLLDEKIIKNMALWSGSPERYFIVRDGADFGKWITDQVLMNRTVDTYLEESKETDLWKYFLLAGIFFVSSGYGTLGILGKIVNKFRKRQ